MKCIVCAQDSYFLFEAIVLFKHRVQYFKCSACGQVQTEEPYWLGEAYEKAIALLDTGLLARNIALNDIVYKLAVGRFDSKKKFLDYGGGYGILVRLLRDRGLDFYRQDIFCENIFAVNHDISDLPDDEQDFELVTCFEVFEHAYEPVKLFEKLRERSSSILVSTLLVPSYPVGSPADWWYIAPETGQHVAFYTLAALQVIAKKFDMNLYSNGENLHLFTVKKWGENPLHRRNNLYDKITSKLKSLLPGRYKNLPGLIEADSAVAKAKAFAANTQSH